MTPADLHDALTLPLHPPTTYTLSTTKARAGDGVQGMTIETERVSLSPKKPCWPAESSVPDCHKKDSIVSSASKVKGKERRLSSSSTFVNHESVTSPGDSDSSGYSMSKLLDENCEPLAKTTSHVSRFSAYGIHCPEGEPDPVDENFSGEWWLERKRRLSRTSFVSAAGRRASQGTADGKVERQRMQKLCKRCFNRRASVASTVVGPEERTSPWKFALGMALANMLFPGVGLALILWTHEHPDQPGPFYVSMNEFLGIPTVRLTRTYLAVHTPL